MYFVPITIAHTCMFHFKERDAWMKKYEDIVLEYASMEKKLENIREECEKQTRDVQKDEVLKNDIYLKYENLAKQCECLNVQTKILRLEKKQEIEKNIQMQLTITRQKKEIEGYKKIIEKVKSMNILFKKREKEKENKLCTIIDNSVVTKKNNEMLKEIVKINDRLIDVYNNVRDKVCTELGDTKKKLNVANTKVKKYHDTLTIISDSYLKYKKEKELELHKMVKLNINLKEQFEKKKSIERHNKEWTTRLTEMNAVNMLLNYYEAKYKVCEESNRLMLGWVHSIAGQIQGVKPSKCNATIINHTTNTLGDNSTEEEKSNSPFFCHFYHAHIRGKKEVHDEEDLHMQSLKRKILADNFCELKIKKENLSLLDMLLQKGEETNMERKEIPFMQMFITGNIIEALYYHMNLVNNIVECLNITLLLLLYIYDTYFKEVINNLDRLSYLESLEKSSIRFASNFYITLSNFLLCMEKYVKIMNSSDNYAHFALLQDERFCNVISLCKYILEQYMGKIKIKLFTSNVDYSLLNVLTEKLAKFHSAIKEEGGQSCYGGGDGGNRGNRGGKEETSEEGDTISSFELACHLYSIIATSVLLAVDKEEYAHLLTEEDINTVRNIQVDVIAKCEELLRLIKLPHKIVGFYFPIKQYKMPISNFMSYVRRFKMFVLIDGAEKNSYIAREKELGQDINMLCKCIVREIQNMLESPIMYSVDIRKKKELFIFQICNGCVNKYQEEIMQKGKNSTMEKEIEEKELVIKKLEHNISDYVNTINMLTKKINELTVRVEKYSKVKIDLDMLKKEKNEYMNIITSLRKSKNENINEVNYVRKQYDEIKNKYNELLKNFELKKKHYICTNKNIENFNLDIYYIKKIMYNLYNENFLIKLKKNYHLFHDDMSYYSSEHNSPYVNFLHSTEEDTSNNFHFSNHPFCKHTHEMEIEGKINSSLNKILYDNIYFVNKNNATLLDDIYNCELVRGRLAIHTIDHTKNGIQSVTLRNMDDNLGESKCQGRLRSSHKSVKQDKKLQELLKIIKTYQSLKDSVLAEIVRTPIRGGNIHMEVKRGSQRWEYLHSQLTQLKSAIGRFSTDNGLTEKRECYTDLNNVLNVVLQGEASTGEASHGVACNREVSHGVACNREVSHGGSKLKGGTVNDHSSELCDKVILNESSFSYLIQNIFNL
ncbi:conserved Plasmodium protein, unknown function [Plasmodium ovale wallikeri]|uniref:Uncharacterized protein n=1 Tax=Plasmodium ovale wallikeri TaxID=864142 RepID=A0A1A8Z886_PLAOA|nr:conserved Plasmodium protein, unknown function [Plasmodium ovale wallikeri]